MDVSYQNKGSLSTTAELWGGRQEIGERGKIGGKERKMDTDKAAQRWRELSDEAMNEMAGWRKRHPKASLREIEKALDERMLKLRAQVLEEAAQLSERRVWSESEERPICPDCKQALEFRLRGKRELQTQGGHSIRLEREYGICPNCGQGFFPPG